MVQNLSTMLIQKTLRVPQIDTVRSGAGGAYARQLDTTLMTVGFKMSSDLFQHVANLHPDMVDTIGQSVLSAVKQLVGAHVQANVYFRDFPHNVPETEEFWGQCIQIALRTDDVRELVFEQLTQGKINLLDLPTYGRYQQNYEEMVASHEAFVTSLSDRMTILHLGKPLEEEKVLLYRELAESRTPANASDRRLLETLAYSCLETEQPFSIPVRENKAIINAIRVTFGKSPIVDTVTDLLRLACHLSGGDVTLQTKTKFKSFPRSVRQVFMKSLDVVGKGEKVRDVFAHREAWKRLGERLHPHEYTSMKHAQRLFAIVRGEDTSVRSFAANTEQAFLAQDIKKAVSLLSHAPGVLFRSLNRLLLNGARIQDIRVALGPRIGDVSSRVLLSVREYMTNRAHRQHNRIFTNSKGKAWVEQENIQSSLSQTLIEECTEWIDSEIRKRLPQIKTLLVDPMMLSVAIPLSGKNVESGFGMLPRGSVSPITGNSIRFFTYWKQKERRTDYDLSTLFLDKDFTDKGYLSWTNLRDDNGVHSGDITEAEDGAFESIDITLSSTDFQYIIPQVLLYSGENFTEVEESFFGFMTREKEQKGLPFEPRTVRMKSEMRGTGKVALPLVFLKQEGRWVAKWAHLYLKGSPHCNTVEGKRVTASMLIRGIVERQYLTCSYLLDLLTQNGTTIELHEGKIDKTKRYDGFLGLERLDNLPEETTVYTPTTFLSLLSN